MNDVSAALVDFLEESRRNDGEMLRELRELKAMRKMEEGEHGEEGSWPRKR